jgi:hypothetical protein
VAEIEIFHLMKRHCLNRRGGPIGDDNVVLLDDRKEAHLFHFEAFYNRHEALAVFTYLRPNPTAVGTA